MDYVDLGSFVKGPVLIEPCANGSYVLRKQRMEYGATLIGSDVVAFSDYKDLLAFLNADYAAANISPASDPKA